jgi:hypothetical protein
MGKFKFSECLLFILIPDPDKPEPKRLRAQGSGLKAQGSRLRAQGSGLMNGNSYR